jgi:FkbM family methyltransferase
MLKGRLRRALVALRLGALLPLWHRLARWDPRLRRREAQFHHWNREAARDEIVVRPGLRLRIDPRSREPFEWFCFRSLEMSRELDAFARAMVSCRNFLDIGACHGIFSLAFAHHRPEAKALAVEPSAVAYSILVENLRRNGLDNVVSKQVACGATAGRLRMRQVWHHLEALPAEGTTADTVEVPMQSLDELCGELDFAPDIVKIDVEGYELAVLSGARGTLERQRPRLFLELHPERLRELGGSAAEVVQLLSALGYRCRDLSGGPVTGRQVEGRESVSRIVCIGQP